MTVSSSVISVVETGGGEGQHAPSWSGDQIIRATEGKPWNGEGKPRQKSKTLLIRTDLGASESGNDRMGSEFERRMRAI